MKKLFKQKLFSEHVKEKMFTQMATEKRRIGLREFAKKANVSPATLNRIEHGKPPDIETFFRLCKWMEIDPNIFN